ncbi:hypothetical protein F5H01DRAFT_316210 [Linnemannia elongata]|nr:hypothetical protein F5H01DRAFT_316210 [Linnemannia elongata]
MSQQINNNDTPTQRVQQVQALNPDEEAVYKRKERLCQVPRVQRDRPHNIRTEKGLVTEQVELERLMSGKNEQRKAKKGEDDEDEEAEDEDSDEDNSDDGDEDNEDEDSEDERKK